MWPVAVALLVVLLSLVFLGTVAWRLFGRVKSLGRTVADAGAQVAAAAEDLDRLSGDRL